MSTIGKLALGKPHQASSRGHTLNRHPPGRPQFPRAAPPPRSAASPACSSARCLSHIRQNRSPAAAAERISTVIYEYPTFTQKLTDVAVSDPWQDLKFTRRWNKRTSPFSPGADSVYPASRPDAARGAPSARPAPSGRRSARAGGRGPWGRPLRAGSGVAHVDRSPGRGSRLPAEGPQNRTPGRTLAVFCQTSSGRSLGRSRTERLLKKYPTSFAKLCAMLLSRRITNVC